MPTGVIHHDHGEGTQASEGLTLSNLGVAYQMLRRSDQAIVFWRDAASAMRDAGDHEQAAHLEQAAANTQARRNR